MRWPRTDHEARVFLAGMSWALLVFWLVVFGVTYLTHGGRL